MAETVRAYGYTSPDRIESRYRNLQPYGEVQLGKRGLYPSLEVLGKDGSGFGVAMAVEYVGWRP